MTIALTGATGQLGSLVVEALLRTEKPESIVAIVRGGGVLPAPGPADVLLVGDTVVAVGTPEGLEHLARIIDGA